MSYWDRISVTPPAPEVLKTLMDLLSQPLGNAQSPYRLGSRSMTIVAEAREKVASLIHCDAREIIFTATGTEANNLVLQGMAISASKKKPGRRILVSAIEHLSVIHGVKKLEDRGFIVELLPVDSQGRVDGDAYRNALGDDVILVSIQLASPEVGTIQDLASLVPAAREKGILFHTDAVDALGWIPVDVKALDVDALTFSGTVFHGPPGAAGFYIRKGVRMASPLGGGNQERGIRPGLENVAAIGALGTAAELAVGELQVRYDHARAMEKRLRAGLSGMESVEFTGDPVNRLPGHVSMIVDYIEGEALLLMLDMNGINAASGSSCTAKDLKISPVIMAMGYAHARAQGSLVFSSVRDTSETDVDHVVEHLPKIVSRLREMSPLWNKKK